MPRLTEQEQQEIIRFLKADKPLPDKFRFLLFEDKREVELVWNGKSSEVCNIVLPFQVIEQVDEPRAEKPADTVLQMSMFDLDARGRQLKGWTNKLIWSDNKLILSSLKNGPLREEIEKQGGLKLFTLTRRLTWARIFQWTLRSGMTPSRRNQASSKKSPTATPGGKGADSFIVMIYERLALMRDLLAENGSIYLHMGPQVNHLVRAVLDEVFGQENSLREIVWQRVAARSHGNYYPATHDYILYYKRMGDPVWNQQYTPVKEELIESPYNAIEPETGRRYTLDNYLNQNPNRPNLKFES